jgi:hypothetical protein
MSTGADLNQHVRGCVRHARRALVDRAEPESRALLEAVASSVLAEVERRRFDDDADVAHWLADLLDEAMAQRDGWMLWPVSSEAFEAITARATLLIELAKWLVPTFGRLSYRDEIARLRAWTHPFRGRGQA